MNNEIQGTSARWDWLLHALSVLRLAELLMVLYDVALRLTFLLVPEGVAG